MSALLAARRVGWRPSKGAPPIVDDVTLELHGGELLVLVGPNGAGKSTLLSLLAGDREPSSGEVELDGLPLEDLEARPLARRRAVMPQSPGIPFGFFAYELVELGRTPWQGVPGRPDDRAVVDEAMRRTDLLTLALRRADVLSGGERARLALARALAQDTAILLLDEPTASLDPRHQHEVMRVARELASEGRGVLAVLHDLNLAARYAHRVAVMHEGRISACGTPAEVLTDGVLQAAYDHPLRVVTLAGSDTPTIVG